jgi:hypothetical protein
VDWSAITGFRYHFDPGKGFWRPVLRIQDYLNGLARTRGWPEPPDELDAAFLRRSFRFFETSTPRTEDFEIIYAIVAPWKGRTPVQALPFFSKVNLDRTVEELMNKGYQVSLSQVDTGQARIRKHSSS